MTEQILALIIVAVFILVTVFFVILLSPFVDRFAKWWWDTVQQSWKEKP